MSIMAAVALSIYRISGSEGNLALFVTFAFINGVYTGESESSLFLLCLKA